MTDTTDRDQLVRLAGEQALLKRDNGAFNTYNAR